MTRRVRSGSPWEPRYGYCRAVRSGDVIEVSGTAPLWPDGSCDADPGIQADRCFELAAAALGELGGSLADVVRTRMYVTDAAYADAVGEAHFRAVGANPPATTMVVVAGLLDPRWKVEIELTARTAAAGHDPS